MLRIALAVIIIAHGLGHILFWVPLLGIADWGQSTRSWLLGADSLARVVGSLLWLVALIGFTVAGIGLLGQQEWWRTAAIAASVVSFVGLLLFLGSPVTSSVIFAGLVDIVVPLSLLVAHWPSIEMLGA